jgi:hypothetical protein
MLVSMCMVSQDAVDGEPAVSSTPLASLSALRCCGIQGSCKDGDACQYAHGVFEVWLHPSRFRTELCKDGPSCTRKVCVPCKPILRIVYWNGCSYGCASACMAGSMGWGASLSRAHRHA